MNAERRAAADCSKHTCFRAFVASLLVNGLKLLVVLVGWQLQRLNHAAAGRERGWRRHVDLLHPGLALSWGTGTLSLEWRVQEGYCESVQYADARLRVLGRAGPDLAVFREDDALLKVEVLPVAQSDSARRRGARIAHGPQRHFESVNLLGPSRITLALQLERLHEREAHVIYAHKGVLDARHVDGEVQIPVEEQEGRRQVDPNNAEVLVGRFGDGVEPWRDGAVFAVVGDCVREAERRNSQGDCLDVEERRGLTQADFPLCSEVKSKKACALGCCHEFVFGASAI